MHYQYMVKLFTHPGIIEKAMYTYYRNIAKLLIRKVKLAKVTWMLPFQ